MLRDLSKINREYLLSELNEEDIDQNPIQQFVHWLDDAEKSEVPDFNAMVLSTVDENAKPSSRVVLLKSVDTNGLIFYTNYTSRKGIQINHNPNVSVVFFWPKLDRQIRIEGTVEKLDFEASDKYFQERPRESQLGAIISPQSKVIPNRDFLIQRKEELEESIHNKKLIRPQFWGGYIISPNLYEFWQGRANRLSDRLQYRQNKENWIIERLAP